MESLFEFAKRPVETNRLRAMWEGTSGLAISMVVLFASRHNLALGGLHGPSFGTGLAGPCYLIPSTVGSGLDLVTEESFASKVGRSRLRIASPRAWVRAMSAIFGSTRAARYGRRRK